MEKVKQSVHPAGRGGFDFVSSSKVVTCGTDGCVRLVSIDPLEDSGFICHDNGDRQFVRIVTNPSNRNCFALAKEEDGFNAFVQLYELSTEGENNMAEPGSRITQTALGICDLSWSKSGVWMAVATDSDGIRVMKVADPVASIVSLKDHQGAVKGVEFDPSESFLASVGADGALRIFSAEANWTCVKTKLRYCERDNSTGSSELADCKPSWSMDGSRLAVPGGRNVRVVKRGDWDEEEEFQNGEFDSPVTLTAFSTSRLAACCGGEQSPKLVIWNLKTKQIEYSFEFFDKTFLRCLRFIVDEAKQTERLVGIDSDGELMQYDLPFSSSLVSTSVTASATGNVVSNRGNQDEAEEEEHVAPTMKLEDVASQDEDKPEVSEEFSMSKIKASLGFNEDGQALPRGASGTADDANADLFAEEEDMVEGDDGEQEQGNGRFVSGSLVKAMQDEISVLRHKMRSLLPPQTQRSFQPGSTEFPSKSDQLDEDPDRRFLAWNNVGTIVCRRDREHQSIEIDFADTSLHRPIRFTDYSMLSKASLSEAGAIFASSGSHKEKDEDADEDQEDPLLQDEPRDAILQYRAFNSPWSSSSNWTFSLPRKEEVTAVACGNEFCVASTSKGFLRVFRPSGLQEPIVLAPGPVLSLAAAGSLLLVLFHTTQRQNDFETGFQLLDFGRETDPSKEFKVLATGTLPCVKGVEWCGFGDESLGFIPMVYRKDGVLLGLSAAANWTWIVLSDGSGLEKGTKLWPISASRSGGLLAVALRNKRKQPSVVPRSSPALFPIHIPILREKQKQKSVKYDHEEAQMQDLIALEQRKWAGLEEDLVRAEAKLDVATLRALIVSVKLNEYPRALGLAAKLRMSKSLDVALEKATEANANQDFLEKLIEMVDERAKQEQMMEEAAEEEEQHVPKRARRDMDEDEADTESVPPNKYAGSASVRVGFNKRPASEDDDEEQDDEPEAGQLSSPVMDKKRNVMPPNPFLKSASPATRDKKAPQRTTPIRLPELSRQSSFTVEAREQYRRRL